MEEVCPGEREDHIDEYDGVWGFVFVPASDYVVLHWHCGWHVL